MSFYDIDAMQNHSVTSLDSDHGRPEVALGLSTERSVFVPVFGCVLSHVASALLRFLKQ